MPLIKSAIKKVRKDKVRTARNDKREGLVKSAIKKVRQTKIAADLQAAFSALDKAAKVKLISKNRASRLKSRLSKGITGTATSGKKSETKKTSKKS